jgi:hypothetical protein
MGMMAITTLTDVKTQFGIRDGNDDVWLTGVIGAVGDAMEAITGRYLWPRPATTSLFDGSDDPQRLDVGIGITSLTYLGISWLDANADGTGGYTTVPLTYVYLDPPDQLRAPGWPASSIYVSPRSGISLPAAGTKRSIKATGDWGPTAVAPRMSQIARSAIGRAWLARQSGSPDYAITTAEGRLRMLRDMAPSEVEELYALNSAAGGYA